MRWEFLALFLLELAFMAIIGLMYAGAVITACVLWEIVERIIYKIIHGKKK